MYAIIAHSDLDGVLSAKLLEEYLNKLNKAYKTVYVTTGNLETNTLKVLESNPDTVIFLDCSPPKSLRPKLKKFIVLDHHPDAISGNTVIQSMPISNTLQTSSTLYKVLTAIQGNKSLVSLLLNLSDIRPSRNEHERLLFSVLDTIRSIGIDLVLPAYKAIEAKVNLNGSATIKQVLEELYPSLVKSCERLYQSELLAAKAGLFEVEIHNEYKIILIDQVKYSSYISLELLNQRSGCVLIKRTNNRYSVRSSGHKLTARQIAQLYDGEGHTNAAGFVLPESETSVDLIKKIENLYRKVNQ